MARGTQRAEGGRGRRGGRGEVCSKLIKKNYFCKGVPPNRPPQAPGMLENQFQQRASCAGVPKVLPQASLAVYLGVKLKSILWEEARNVNTDICNQKISKKCLNFVSTFLFFTQSCFAPQAFQNSLRGLVMVDLKKLRKVQGLSDASSLC